jgi:hypothetical protein
MGASEERVPLLRGPGLLLIQDFCRSTGLERGTVEALLREGRLEGGVFDEWGAVVGLFDDALPTGERLRNLGLTVSAGYAPDDLRSYEDQAVDEDDDGTAGPTWTMSWQDDKS